MSQAEALASHWVLLFFLGLLNKYMLAWSIDYAASVGLSSARQDYIHRTWSGWTIWSACSRTCGGGVKMRTRVCKMSMAYGHIPFPNACIGDTIEYELCSVHNCSPRDKEFLEYQCSLRDGQSIRGRRVEEWIPYRYGKNTCELQCWSKDRTLVHSFGKAIDGTKCATEDPRQPALCINGRCTPVDCAGQIGLDNRLDRCGVCRGDNSTCIHFQDTFWKRPRTKIYEGSKDHHYDYEKIATIPAGAAEIIVRESSETNFIALMDHKGQYQVNGNWRVQSPGRSRIHGSEFLYNRTWNGIESLSTDGPIRYDVHIYVLGSGDIPTVYYEYLISSNNPFKPVPALQTSNQIKRTGAHENKFVDHEYLQPENNHIHDISPTKKPVIPVTKFQGYKSYYHRNEILKSVPSWSIKRHRTHKNDLTKHFRFENDISTTLRRSKGNSNTEFVPLDSKQVPSTSREETKVEINVGLDKNNHKSYSRVHSTPTNTKLVQSKNRSEIAVSKKDNGQRSSRLVPLNHHERYDLTHRRANTIAPPRKSVFEKFDLSTEDYGRPTTTMTLTRKANNYRKSPVTLQPKFPGRKVDLNPEFDRGIIKPISTDKRKHSKNRRKLENGECLPCSKPKHQKKNFCSSEFVLRAVVLSVEKQEDAFRYELGISQSFKNKVPISSREYIWTTDSCPCPKLRTGREYIIMGYSGLSGNRRESRLLINNHSFVRKYSPKRGRTMLRLVRKQRELCKDFI